MLQFFEKLFNTQMLALCFVGMPVVFCILMLITRKSRTSTAFISLMSAGVNLVLAIALYMLSSFNVELPLGAGDILMQLKGGMYQCLFILLTAFVFILISTYNVTYLKADKRVTSFMIYLNISLAMVNGAFLSDNMGIMLFFWEGLLCTLFGMLLLGNLGKPKTAVKALTISGIADLLLMGGIIITAHNAGTLRISEISALPLSGSGWVGFLFMFLGAIGKAGSMPFHSWIPDAAKDAPTPFMVSFPGALEKLVGMYLAVRLVSGMYNVTNGSPMSTAIMVIGALTILFAVAMALIQKDMKRLLAYHAVSQVGYMVLGIGSCLPIGILGGLFHMLNNAVYKSCLFMCAGAVEKRTGTTDLRKFGGLFREMPLTGVCFIMSGLAIAGVPPFNGFFSKELIFDAALESNIVFYIAALLGAVLTAISFLKMGRAAFFGKRYMPVEALQNKPRTPAGMLIPMAFLALMSLLGGLFNVSVTDRLFGTSLGYTDSYGGWPHSVLLVVVSIAALCIAVADHVYGYKKTGSAITAADHIHEAPVLRQIYSAAEKGWFDPYKIIRTMFKAFASVGMALERGFAYIYDTAIPKAVTGAGDFLSNAVDGSVSRYIFLALFGLVGVALILIMVLI